MSSNPTIKWSQVKINNDTLSEIQLENNTVTYDAVQAGLYSNAICVKPKFAGTGDDIGCVRIWWSDYKGKLSDGSEQSSLPGTGWVLKYYVTDCKTVQAGENSSTNDATKNCYNMLNFLSNSQNVQKVTACGNTVQLTVNGEKQIDFGENQCWCQSTWGGGTAETIVAMQPLPFNGYLTSLQDYASVFAQSDKYGNQWYTKIFSVHDGNYNLLNYAAGGTLYSSDKCNVINYVHGTQNSSKNTTDFPYIFFSIKPPQDASAGTWSGWACRISYIWPFDIPDTATV